MSVSEPLCYIQCSSYVFPYAFALSFLYLNCVSILCLTSLLHPKRLSLLVVFDMCTLKLSLFHNHVVNG